MSETWVQANLWFKMFDDVRYRRLLLEFVSRAMLEVESKDLVKTFHFLFEAKLHFLLRIEPSDRNGFDDVKSIAKKHLLSIRDFLTTHPEEEQFTEYHGEAEDYGEEGWLIAKKVLEMGSRMAIAKVDPALKSGKKFEEGKLLHCFLNSIGHSTFGVEKDGKLVTSEALFHLNQFLGRMLIIRHKRSVDSEVESETKRLVHQRIETHKRTSIETV